MATGQEKSVVTATLVVDFCVDGVLQHELVRAAEDLPPGGKLSIELVRDHSGKLDILGFVHRAQAPVTATTTRSN
jgi:hypothetical protein